jgi:hypothetical protein
MLKFQGLPLCVALFCGLAQAQALNYDLQGYKANDGLKARMRGSALEEFTWRGEGDRQFAGAIHNPLESPEW